MANIDQLVRQHEEIREIFENMNKELKKGIGEENVDGVVKAINVLAGKLKVHMGTEDRFLYPALKASNIDKLKQIEKQYSEEMANLANAFEQYKQKYNTRSKALTDVTVFAAESREILKLMVARIDREDRMVYPEMKQL